MWTTGVQGFDPSPCFISRGQPKDGWGLVQVGLLKLKIGLRKLNRLDSTGAFFSPARAFFEDGNFGITGWYFPHKPSINHLDGLVKWLTTISLLRSNDLLVKFHFLWATVAVTGLVWEKNIWDTYFVPPSSCRCFPKLFLQSVEGVYCTWMLILCKGTCLSMDSVTVSIKIKVYSSQPHMLII